MKKLVKVPIFLILMVALVIQLIPLFTLKGTNFYETLIRSCFTFVWECVVQYFYLSFCKDNFDLRRKDSTFATRFWTDNVTKVFKYIASSICLIASIGLLIAVTPTIISTITSNHNFKESFFYVLIYIVSYLIIILSCFSTYKRGQKIMEKFKNEK